MTRFDLWSAASYDCGAAGLRAGALFLLFLAAPVVAQPVAGPGAPGLSADRLAADRVAAERAHLWRVGAWGAANVAAGTLLLATQRTHPGRRAFGIQSAAWGAVNVGIAAFALSRAAPETLLTLGEALRAEGHLGDVLWLNLGLDAGYAAVGVTLWIVAARGVANPAAWRGHGQAVVLQGAALFTLDAVVLAGSGGRVEALARLAETAVLLPAAGAPGLSLVVAL